jgi:PAS domain S-box-containing protein
MRGVTNRLPRYGVAIVTTAGASLLALILSPLSLRVPFALFAAAVIFSSLEGGLKPGLLVTALSTAALAVQFWLLPLAQLPENHGEVVPLLVLFVVLGLVSNYLGEQCWRAVHAAEWVQETLASFDEDFIFTDAQGRVRSIHPVAHPLTGWNKPYPALARSRERPRSGGCQAVVAEAVPHIFKNGARQAVDAELAPILEQNGSVLGATLLLSDVSTRRQRKREVQRREEQFRALAACAPAGIMQMDPACRCVYANCSGQLLGGFSAEEGQGEGWARFLHPEDRARVVPAWVAAMQAGKEFACEFRFQIPQPRGRWVRLRSSPMVSDLGKLFGHVAVFHDIDNQKLAEEALRETRTLLSAVAESLRQCQARQQSESP